MPRWLDGLEEEAQRLLPEAVARYFQQGSGEGVTAAEAEQAWRSVRLWPRMLRDVSTVSTATTVLGTPLTSAVAIAPTTLQRHTHDEGEVAMARAAAAAGSLVCVSSNAGSRYVDIAATGAAWWLQVYVLHDRDLTAEMLDRAVAAEARAVVVTVDTPVVGHKEDGDPTVWDLTPDDYLHANHEVELPTAGDHPTLMKAADLTPDVVGWLAQRTGLPVVVKGILRPDDAIAAVDAGAAAVWVSNHGGRQLDRAVATRWALPAVADAVGDRVEVYVDGGVRRGVDVLTARALGADAVFLGRPSLWALAVGGEEGVVRLLDDLRIELVEAMQLAGHPSWRAVARDLIRPPGTE